MGNLSNAIKALTDRMTAHVQTGGMLEGWQLVIDGKRHVQGKKDYPAAELLLPLMSEQYRPGGRRTIADPSMEVHFSVVGSADESLENYIKKLELFLDAIDTNAARQINLNLDGSLELPFSMQVNEIVATDLSRSAEVVLILKPRPSERGRRST